MYMAVLLFIYCQSLLRDNFICINITLLDNRESSISSDPLFVCICDSKGQPLCTNTSFNDMTKSVHPGETFALSAAIVGLEYGMTVGTVHAGFLPLNKVHDGSTTASDSVPILDHKNYQYSQWIGNTSCSALTYTVFSEHINHNYTMYLTAQYTTNPKSLAEINYWKYCRILSLPSPLKCRHSPIRINVTVLPCPMGFSLLRNPSRCDCYPALIEKNVRCAIVDGTGYFIWSYALWISVNNRGVVYSENCLLNHCTETYKVINLIETPNAQCTFNRAGRLRGGCKKGYSLAIGSSNCIHCPNNSNLSLLTFFIAAGFLLVFFIMFSVFNLTITQGMINGFIFYANIVWTSQSIFLPFREVNNVAVIFLRTFLAWINLDFGIETCFVSGLTALGKTWLQFLFPTYIWVIAGLMIITAKYSKILTKLMVTDQFQYLQRSSSFLT